MWTATTREHFGRRTNRYQSDRTDEEWGVIEPYLPPAKRMGRPRAWPLREIVNAVFYVMRGGIAAPLGCRTLLRLDRSQSKARQ